MGLLMKLKSICVCKAFSNNKKKSKKIQDSWNRRASQTHYFSELWSKFCAGIIDILVPATASYFFSASVYIVSLSLYATYHFSALYYYNLPGLSLSLHCLILLQSSLITILWVNVLLWHWHVISQFLHRS